MLSKKSIPTGSGDDLSLVRVKLNIWRFCADISASQWGYDFCQWVVFEADQESTAGPTGSWHVPQRRAVDQTSADSASPAGLSSGSQVFGLDATHDVCVSPVGWSNRKGSRTRYPSYPGTFSEYDTNTVRRP